MKLTTEATIHYCDGCGSTHVQLKGDDLPRGLYMEVTDITECTAQTGAIFACAEKCIIQAFRRRYEIWNRTTLNPREDPDPTRSCEPEDET